MPIKPPPLIDIVQQVNSLIGDNPLKTEVDRGARALVHNALAKMDLVSRDDFDIQADILLRTRARVQELEAQLQVLTDALEQDKPNS